MERIRLKVSPRRSFGRPLDDTSLRTRLTTDYTERNQDGLAHPITRETLEYLPFPTHLPLSPEASPSSSRLSLQDEQPLDGSDEQPLDGSDEQPLDDSDEGYGGSDIEMERDANTSRTSRKRRRDSFTWQDPEPLDPYRASYLPLLPPTTPIDLQEQDLATSDPSFRPDEPLPLSLTSESDSAQIERELTARRTNRTQLDPYTSAPIAYASSALRYAHTAPGSGTGFKSLRPSTDSPRPIPSLIPSTLPSLIKAYGAAKQAARDPPQSMSARSYRATLADIVVHTTGHPTPFILASNTLQIPGSGKSHERALPRGNPFVPSFPVYASSGEPVNEGGGGGNERTAKRSRLYPTDRSHVVHQETYPPGLAMNLPPSSRHSDHSRPCLMNTLLTEFPGHPDPARETYAFPRSSWLKPSLLRSSTRIAPPPALRVDSTRAAEEGLKEGDLALYGEPVRAPGQPDLEGKAARRARDRKKFKDKGSLGVPKIRFTINDASNGTTTMTTTTGPLDAITPTTEAVQEEKDEILLRATWPIAEDRGDWQTRLELPQEDAKETGNLIAYGWGRRPISVTASTPIDPESTTERLSGVFRYPKSEETRSIGPTERTVEDYITPASARRGSSIVPPESPGDGASTPAVPRFKFKIKTPVSEYPPSPSATLIRAPPGSMPPPITPSPGQESRGEPITPAHPSYHRTPSIKLKLPGRAPSSTPDA
jgi:hypothetical protein